MRCNYELHGHFALKQIMARLNQTFYTQEIIKINGNEVPTPQNELNPRQVSSGNMTLKTTTRLFQTQNYYVGVVNLKL